jgi:PIN domain nuclease of toxin-antitoxin system
MRLLLDTHAFLWWQAGGSALAPAARQAIEAPDSVVYLSAASAWEMAIKRAKGRLESPTDVAEAVDANGFRELPISVVHAQSAGVLPPHHTDPFDRLLIAQAQLEGLTIVTRDPAFVAYGVSLLIA